MRIVRALAALAVGVVAISMAPNGAAQQRPPNPGPAGPKDAKAVQTPCELRIGDAPIRAIVSGADLQNLALQDDSAQGCAKDANLPSKVRWVRDVTDPNRRWEARVHTKAGVVFLEVRGAAPTQGELRQFELGGEESVVARLSARVVGLPTATSGALTVRYDDPELDAAQTGRSRLDGSGKPIAVAGGAVWNTATMSFPSAIPAESRYDVGASSQKKEPKDAISHYEWDIFALSVLDAKIPRTDDANDKPEESKPGTTTARKSQTRLIPQNPGPVTSVGSITFRTPWSQLGPVVAGFALKWKDSSWEEIAELLQFHVQVASSVADESVPMDTRPVTQLECKAGSVAPRDIARHNETVGVDKTAAQNGQCRLVVDLCNQEASRLVDRGPQRLRVRVRREKDSRETTDNIVLPFPRDLAVEEERLEAAKRDSASTSTKNNKQAQDGSWKKSCRSVHYLTLPGNTESTDAVYSVTVSHAEESETYHRRSIGKDDYPFEARIRMRGTYGFDTAVRVFVTVPVNFTGVRFPANPPELSSSSDSRFAQLATPSAGVLVGFEPWDYRFARSSLPIPLRPQAGFHVVDVTERRRGFALLAGTTATVPGLEAGDLSVNLGVFYENDLRETHPLLTGHRLLFTTSVNFLASPAKTDAKN